VRKARTPRERRLAEREAILRWKSRSSVETTGAAPSSDGRQGCPFRRFTAAESWACHESRRFFMKSNRVNACLALLVIGVLGVISTSVLRAARERSLLRTADNGPWLILNGEFVSAPYAVEALDDQILINSRPFYLPRDDAVVEIPPHISGATKIISEANRRGREIARNEGIDAAEQWALGFFMSHPEVLAVECNPGPQFVIHWADDGFEGHALRIGFDWTHLDPDADKQPRDSLSIHDRAEELRYLLASAERLVILTDGIVQTIPPAGSAARLQLIREICKTPTDVATKRQRLQDDAGVHGSAASMIAERLIHK